MDIKIGMSGSYYYHPGLTVRPGDTSLVPYDVDAPPVIDLSISVTLVRGVRSSMTRGDFNNFIIPICNRIWHKAGIQFSLLGWQETPYGLEVHHDNSFMDPEAFDPDFLLDRRADLNVFILPFSIGTRLGCCRSNMESFNINTSRGFVDRLHSYIVLYEEKYNRLLGGRRERFNLGTLGRVLAHEIGHSLGLGHVEGHDSAAMKSLMYGGYACTGDPLPGGIEGLSPQEIAHARNTAVRLGTYPLRLPYIESLPPWARWLR